MSRFGALAKVLGRGAMLCGLAATQAQVTESMLRNEADGHNWASYGRTYAETHYSPLNDINGSTVSRLKLAWSYDLNTSLRVDSQPLEAEGVVYVAVGLSIVHAFDARTGRLMWSYDPSVGLVAGDRLRPSWGIRGLALGGSRVFVGTQDGRLIALDAASGRLLWSQMTLRSGDETSITGAPRFFNGKVIIGFAGGERTGTRGAVSCYDAESGKRLWRFYTVPGDPSRGFENSALKMAATTWSGEWWKNGGGGTVWNAMTFDSELNRVYIGTGNAEPWNWNIRNPRRLDNLFTASIVALDANTGDYIWHYQVNPNDAWDFDAAMDLELARLRINGRSHRVLMQAPKDGFFYVIDRDSGKLLSAEPIETVSWADHIDLMSGRPVEHPGIRYEVGHEVQWPGTYGAHNWPPMSFSPRLQLAYIPTIHMADAYTTLGIDANTWKPERNHLVTGLGSSDEDKLPTEEFGSALLAWDPAHQRSVWKVTTPGIWGGGTMVTGGDLVFQGHLDGTFNAYDAASGHNVWSFDAGIPVTGAPITYSVAGRQYITVLAGPIGGTAAYIGGNARFHSNYQDPRRVLTFALDADGARPTRSPRALPGALSVPAVEAQNLTVPANGAAVYASNCTQCHGLAAVSGGAAPDLRVSPVILSRDAFDNTVRDGPRVSAGMPKFADLAPSDIEAIREYILGRALATGAATAGSQNGRGDESSDLKSH